MFQIAICDDEAAFTDGLREDLERYARETGREFGFFIYRDGSELLERYHAEYDLIFMDIKMERTDGLRAAEEIRKIDRSVGLMFLTSFKQYVWKGYEYGAAGYLLKPVAYGVLKMELDRFFLGYRGKDEPYLSFSNHSGKYKALYRDICYAETARRNVLVHFEKMQEQVIFKSMKEISALLCAHRDFAQCHQSFIVNLAYVRAVQDMELILTTGARIPVSQPRRKKFMAELTDYWGDLL